MIFSLMFPRRVQCESITIVYSTIPSNVVGIPNFNPNRPRADVK
jgi:hypothetical protein